MSWLKLVHGESLAYLGHIIGISWAYHGLLIASKQGPNQLDTGLLRVMADGLRSPQSWGVATDYRWGALDDENLVVQDF